MTDKQKEALDILIREYSSLNITKDEFYILTEFIIEEKQTYMPQPWTAPITTPFIATGLTGETISDAATTIDNEMLNKKVEELPLTIPTKNLLWKNGVNTLADICRLHKTDVLKFKGGYHKKALVELDIFLKDRELRWEMNV